LIDTQITSFIISGIEDVLDMLAQQNAEQRGLLSAMSESMPNIVATSLTTNLGIFSRLAR
jgi:hypothetical protein